MKKLLAIVLAVMLAVAMLSLPAMAVSPTDISKTMSPDPAKLGDYVLVTINVHMNAGDTSVTVYDYLPSELTLMPASVSVPGGCTVVSAYDHYLRVSLPDGFGDYAITFNAQVTSVEALAYDVTNTARLQYYLGGWHDIYDYYILDLLPYEGFTKTTEDPLEVPVNTEVSWTLNITVTNVLGDNIATMNNIVVKDRLGGDLEMDSELTPAGFIHSKKTGNTDKEHLTWKNIPNLADGASVQALLYISTDRNPGGKKQGGPGHQEYTEAGEHDLNSGAVLKFTDPATGFQLSAHTPSITVLAYEP